MRVFIISLILIFTTELHSIYAKDLNPWEWDNIKYKEEIKSKKKYIPNKSGNPVIILLLGSIKFYQNNISPRKLQKCPCYPSCSRFAYNSISKYGIWGIFMMVDRLFYRENNDMHNFYKLIELSDGYRFYDPPENNYIFNKSDWRLEN